MKDNKYGYRDVFDILVFDEFGNQVAKLNTIKKHKLIYDNKEAYLLAKDALLDINILKFLGEKEIKQQSDYDSILNGGKKYETIILNQDSNKKCKLIAKTYLRDYNTGKDKECVVEIPEAEIVNRFVFDGACEGNPSVFDIIFKINSFSLKRLFKVHIEI